MYTRVYFCVCMCVFMCVYIFLAPLRVCLCVCVCVLVTICVRHTHTGTKTHTYLQIHNHTHTMTHTQTRPTQSIMYVPLQVNRSQKCMLLIVQYKYIKSCSGDLILQNLILRTRLCGTMFITQPSCPFDFHLTESVRRK